MPPRRARVDDGAGERALRGTVETDVDESRAGHLGGRNPRHMREVLGKRGRDLTRRQPGGFGEGKGHARGVVAVFA